MEPSDVAAVYQLSCENFSEPWSLDSIEKEIANPVATYYVAEMAGEIIGFGGMWHVLDEGEIMNIAVAKESQRQGVGYLILSKMMETVEKKQLRRVHLEVRAGNEGAQKLYKKKGFTQIAIRKAYYRDPVEDALIMEWMRT